MNINETLYSRFKLNKCRKVTDILHNTKKIILHPTSYKQYITDYSNQTQLSSFKEPNKTTYPILTNPYYISLKKRKELFSLETESSINSLLIKKKNNKPKLFINIGLSDSSDMSDDSDSDKSELFVTRRKINSAFVLKNRKGRHHEEKQSFSSMFNSEIALLIEILFEKRNEFENLKYNEEEIFHREDHYYAFIRDKIKELKSKGNEINKNAKITRKFESSKGNLELTLYCAKIEINCEYRTFSYEIPFELLPLIYNLTSEEIQLMFSAFLDAKMFSKEVSIDKAKSHMESAFISALSKAINSRSEFIANTNNINEENYEIISLFKLRNENNENDLLTYDIQEGEVNANIIVDRIKAKEKSKKKLFTKSKNFNFSWATKGNIYNFSISMPEIMLSFNTIKKQVNINANSELMLYLIEKNFVNWDFYCVYYLFSFKTFREFVKSLYSKTRKGKSEKNEKKQIEFLSLNRRKKENFDFIINETKFSFLFTDDLYDMNHLLILKSFSIYVYFRRLNANKIFAFDFNFNQMRILFLISKRENLKNFIRKILICDFAKSEIRFDYTFFDLFANKTAAEIDADFDKFCDKTKRLEVPQFRKSINDQIDIHIDYPRSEIITFAKLLPSLWKRKKIFITQRTLYLLISSFAFDKWVSILCESEIFNISTLNANEYFDTGELQANDSHNGNTISRKTWKPQNRNRRGYSEHSYAKFKTPKANAKLIRFPSNVMKNPQPNGFIKHKPTMQFNTTIKTII